MPNSDIASPPVAAPVDRMTLGVDSVRPVQGDRSNPSFTAQAKKNCMCMCFEGIDE